ncbi:PREDICTED: uncharacterized protein LOC108516604 [Rhinopithecus bieti]|uniref:uncharacterized protein LOC108516604 n=1 Tax=Rhinopithecus bieti TaxID=61621 RepID=UPI00053359B5|nr:PREDICTED: uncharacterized protein LOC108516604 [Rhinopithecus bieti]
MGKCTHHGFSGCSSPRTPMGARRRPQTQRGASSTRDPLKATCRAVSGRLADPEQRGHGVLDLSRKDPAMVLHDSPTRTAHQGLSARRAAARGTERVLRFVCGPLPPSPLTPLPGASALTCQCGGSSGPALSTRGAECGRGQSRRGSARGQRDRE